MKKLVGPVALGCAVLLTVGCGISGPTKAEYIKQADAICATTDKKIQQLSAKLIGMTDLDAVRDAIAAQLIPVLETAQADLRALEIPAGEEKRIGAILDALDTDLAAVRKKPLALAGEGAFADAFALADAYGFRDCAH